MGMFDYYQPAASLCCPACGVTPAGWQGKTGPRALFTWREGHKHPVDQALGGDMRLDETQLADWILPPRFEIHTSCGSCRKWVIAVGRCEGDVWASTELMTPDNAERYP